MSHPRPVCQRGASTSQHVAPAFSQNTLANPVDGRHRTTVLSVNSMVALSAGAVVLAVAAPLYLVARSASRPMEVSSTLSPKQRSMA